MSDSVSRLQAEILSTPPSSDRDAWRAFYAHSHEWVGEVFCQHWEAQLARPEDQWLAVENDDWRW